MSLETTIKVSREFRKKLKIAKGLDQTYQEYLQAQLGIWHLYSLTIRLIVLIVIKKFQRMTEKKNLIVWLRFVRWIFRRSSSVATTTRTLTDKDMIFQRVKKRSKSFTHDFSLVISKQKSYCVIFCQDFPSCQEQITIFRDRS